MRTVFLVPWRTDDGPRAAAWKLCKRRWTALFPDWPIYEGRSPDGPFQRAAAINDAAAQAGSWDMAVIIDADVMLPAANVQEAVKRATKTGKVTWAHRRWRELSQYATEKLTGPKGYLYAETALGPGGLEGDLSALDQGGHPIVDLIVTSTTALSMSCCMAVRRDAWDKMGGFDERFVGWGHEDSAFAAASAHYAGWDRVEGDVLNLWHPRIPGAGRADKRTRDLYTPAALANARLGIRYTVALRRDLGWNDKPEKASQELLDRDIANLIRQDTTEMAVQQTAQERKAWDNWWPTIPELVEGARLYRRGSVTVVVHTGGELDKWPERKAYLEQSIPSLTENVTGSIIQRVIYDCWGDGVIRDWLSDTFGPLGYYVVGPTERPDFTGSMQAMWKYLAKRAKGDYIFAVEDDFTYERPVDLGELIEVLRANPNVFQVALLRDPCYGDEADLEAIGNILGWPRPAFTFHEGWFEHRLFFTCNPSVFHRSLTERPWPSGHHSETLFGKALLKDAAMRSAFWGDGEVFIRHIGKIRAGTGY